MRSTRTGGEPAPLSGDGFVTLADGTVRWGRYGAAGVLVRCALDPGGARGLGGTGTSGASDARSAGSRGGDDDDAAWWYFLARRSEWCHQGGCWAIPGGALDHGETPVEGALREFAEEVGDVLGDCTVAEVHEDDHGGWSYWTVVVEVPERFVAPEPANWETAETGWVSHQQLAELDLHDGFRRTLVRLGYLLEPGA